MRYVITGTWNFVPYFFFFFATDSDERPRHQGGHPAKRAPSDRGGASGHGYVQRHGAAQRSLREDGCHHAGGVWCVSAVVDSRTLFLAGRSVGRSVTSDFFQRRARESRRIELRSCVTGKHERRT